MHLLVLVTHCCCCCSNCKLLIVVSLVARDAVEQEMDQPAGRRCSTASAETAHFTCYWGLPATAASQLYSQRQLAVRPISPCSRRLLMHHWWPEIQNHATVKCKVIVWIKIQLSGLNTDFCSVGLYCFAIVSGNISKLNWIEPSNAPHVLIVPWQGHQVRPDTSGWKHGLHFAWKALSLEFPHVLPSLHSRMWVCAGFCDLALKTLHDEIPSGPK